ncbi:MAG TPA: NnrS family protein [Methylomirabilota bacterium]|nr:NnrS family protein [Methylomirabilota bacterium]
MRRDPAPGVATVGSAGEPPVYRRFALLAFGTAAVGGVPLGAWMLTRLYWGGGEVPPAWLLLHAHLQIFELFGVMILGIAHHLVPRFAGRPVVPARAPRLFVLVTVALALRIGGTASGHGGAVFLATALEAAAFAWFAVWLRRGLAAPDLALTRRHLGLATGWWIAALAVEAGARWPGKEPDPRAMRAVYAMALLGGAGGWILGVLLRAAPMFVSGWRISTALGRVAPWTLGAGVVAAVAGAAGGGAAGPEALGRLGEALAAGTISAIALTGGALGRRRRAPALLLQGGQGGPDRALFRLAMVSVTVATVGFAVGAAMAAAGVPLGFLGDALRHLFTVGFLTTMVVTMAFRLIPVLERVRLPWPRLRNVAFAALLAGVLLRSSEVLADWVWAGVLPWLPLSGLLVWVAVGSALVSLLETMRAPRRLPVGSDRAA